MGGWWSHLKASLYLLLRPVQHRPGLCTPSVDGPSEVAVIFDTAGSVLHKKGEEEGLPEKRQGGRVQDDSSGGAMEGPETFTGAA